MAITGYNQASAPVAQSRIGSILERFETLASQAGDLSQRIEKIVDRTIGPRPKNEGEGKVAPVPNGTMQSLEELDRRIGYFLERIRNDLQELESVL